ncbi:hypothetical protein, partial [Lactobacillus delbrueckii]|uniref:hypothetical protein n=1 Tax=Lactobacillus delbrueckii TaxID=1584 RepID=UPI0021A60CDA
LTPNLTAFTGVDSQNLPDVMVSVQFILAIGDKEKISKKAVSAASVARRAERVGSAAPVPGKGH